MVLFLVDFSVFSQFVTENDFLSLNFEIHIGSP